MNAQPLHTSAVLAVPKDFTPDELVAGFRSNPIGSSRIVMANCLEWLSQLPPNSIHGIVTDPPYGLTEYEAHQLQKRANGRGGIWRIPPSFDGAKRAPLPRFTALNDRERAKLSEFFTQWSKAAVHALRPGAHVFIATNSFMSQLLYSALVAGGMEYRGELIRLVKTLRGGDRPKNAEKEFPNVSSLPKGCFEPWGIFRKPLPAKMTVAECLRRYQTGGLRRTMEKRPLDDVLQSERTPAAERKLAKHPSLKPQALMRKLVYSILPLGEGIVVDPFMGSGSTVAAAEAVGVKSIGVELHEEFYELACKSIPLLAGVGAKKVKSGRGKSSSIASSQSQPDLRLPL